MAEKFYITTSIPYLNAPPHVGHALEFIQGDVLARYARLQGYNTYFLTGTDEHGAKIKRAADAAGKDPQKFVDDLAKKFINLTKALNISNDDFIRTSDRKRHWPAAQKIWHRLAAAGDLYKKNYEGLYCVGHEAFIKKSELEDGLCPIHKTEPEIIREENWFFKLTKYKNEIKKRIESNDFYIIPETRKQEVLNLLDDAEDVSFSRPAKDLSWGIPVPDDSSQTMYVWADALTNYISALGYIDDDKKFRTFWPADVHLIGKDILRFHAIIWPAILLSAGLELPKAIYVHGFITVDGQKMSKTLGNVIDPFNLVEKYGAETVRYFLLREIPSGDDGDFSSKNLETRYNSDLADGIGNLAARISALAEKETFKSGTIIDKDILNKINEVRTKVGYDLKEFKLHEALAVIWDLIAFGNAYVNQNRIWETRDSQKIFSLVVLLDNIAYLLLPFLPQTAEKITQAIQWKNGVLQIHKGQNLFPRRL
ncbi:MAG TPA: class I tRNA ligase family protein [Candidatus Paceibacterota bacterium]|nr:class I tRNA ligase family protein [Candidatus Paceibacterota bacterium]